jgi:hypothetical protein
MLIAEDLLLLLTDDDTGKLVVTGSIVDIALGGALLVELSMSARADVDARKRLVLSDGSPLGDELLDRALEVVQRREGKKPSAVISELAKKLRPELYARLAAGGLVREEHGKILGLFPTTAWPTASADHEAGVRRSVTSALVQGLTPTPRAGALIALLHAMRATHKVVVPKEHGLRRRELDRRAKEIAEGNWGSQAVRDAVDAMMAAVMAAVTASSIAATSASG